MSTRDLARVSGLSKSTVSKISQLGSWRTVSCAQMQQFSLACGINFLDSNSLKSNRHFWRHNRLIYLKNAEKSQRDMFDRMIQGLSGRALSGPASNRTESRSPTTEDVR